MWWLGTRDPKDKLIWQPTWPVVKIEDVPPASVLLYYNGNGLTEKEARVKGFPFKDPPFHASFYLGLGKHLNQGMTALVGNVTDEYRSTRRVDVISYPDLNNDDRKILVEDAWGRLGRAYDVPGFLSFGLPFLREWAFANFCSEQVAEIFDSNGYRVSLKEPSKTAPFHLWNFAQTYPKNAILNTLWVGEDYPGGKNP